MEFFFLGSEKRILSAQSRANARNAEAQRSQSEERKERFFLFTSEGGVFISMDMDKIRDIQERLQRAGVDGWLLYDFRRSNDLAGAVLEIPTGVLLSRRFFYWIPARGKPIKIVHAIETYALDHLPGEKRVYLSWQSLEEAVKSVAHGVVAMEYSARNAIPYISKVDGGVIDMVRSFGVEVVSSGPFLQHYTCVWGPEELESHLYAAGVLDRTAAKVWDFLSDQLKRSREVTEYDVQQLMLAEFKKHKCITGADPFCGVNGNSANPHYAPTKDHFSPIQRGDFVLIDLWCKREGERSTYADITRVAVAAGEPTEKQEAIFTLVRSAQRKATEFVQERVESGKEVKGYEVDEVCRGVIKKAGYGEFFTHRTGHNIHTEDHGPGAHLDSLETYDERPLIPRTCFSIEPGIYLPDSFGVRLEYDVYISEERQIRITGGIQDHLIALG
jgi:Xaa-Pro dipeptidase